MMSQNVCVPRARPSNALTESSSWSQLHGRPDLSPLERHCVPVDRRAMYFESSRMFQAKLSTMHDGLVEALCKPAGNSLSVSHHSQS